MRNEVEQLHGQMLNNSARSTPSTHNPAPSPAPAAGPAPAPAASSTNNASSSSMTRQPGEQGQGTEPLSSTQQTAASNASNSSARESMDGVDREKFGILEVRHNLRCYSLDFDNMRCSFFAVQEMFNIYSVHCILVLC